MPIREENRMGKWGATSYMIGNIIGSGIFITPTSVFENSSSVGVALIIWVLSGMIATLGAFCYLELGTSIRRSGGDFAYLCFVKWKPVAFAFMIMGCLFTYPATISVQIETFGEYVIQGLRIEFCSEFHKICARKFIGFSLIMVLLYINFFSIRTVVARFSVAAMIAKIISTGIVIFIGLYFLFIKGKTENLENPFRNTTIEPSKIVNAFFAGLFSFDGWDILNFGNEDVHNPRKSMTFAILVGMATVAFIYLTMNLSFFTILTGEQIKSTHAVGMTFAKYSLGNTFQYLMPFLVCIVLIGAINGTLFMATRYTYAASRERYLPSFLSCINLQHDSPRAAIFITVVLIISFTFLDNIETLISYVGFSHWFQRLATMCALFYIRFHDKPVHSEAIRIPIFLPMVFAFICFCLVGTTIFRDFLTGFVAILMVTIGLCTYFLTKLAKRFGVTRKCSYFINDFSCFFSQMIFNGEIELIDRTKKMDARHKLKAVASSSASQLNNLAARENGNGISAANYKSDHSNGAFPPSNQRRDQVFPANKPINKRNGH